MAVRFKFKAKQGQICLVLPYFGLCLAETTYKVEKNRGSKLYGLNMEINKDFLNDWFVLCLRKRYLFLAVGFTGVHVLRTGTCGRS